MRYACRVFDNLHTALFVMFIFLCSQASRLVVIPDGMGRAKRTVCL